MVESLASAVRAFGLSAVELHVVVERLAGRSYSDIAGDAAVRKPDGTAYTRQRVKQFEQEALGKLGLAGSVEAVVHRAERRDAAVRLRERGRQAVFGTVRPTRGGGRGRPERWEVRHERRVARFLAERGESASAG